MWRWLHHQTNAFSQTDSFGTHCRFHFERLSRASVERICVSCLFFVLKIVWSRRLMMRNSTNMCVCLRHQVMSGFRLLWLLQSFCCCGIAIVVKIIDETKNSSLFEASLNQIVAFGFIFHNHNSSNWFFIAAHNCCCSHNTVCVSFNFVFLYLLILP